MRRTVTLCCVFMTLLSADVCAQGGGGRPASTSTSASTSTHVSTSTPASTSTHGSTPARAVTPLPLEHGGKIESAYDGFAHETVVALRRMSVTCESAKGLQSTLKGVCVSLQASLHCPGKQLDYVRRATLRLTFESKNWDSRHPADERELTAVADGETLRLGRMQLAGQSVGESWFAEDAKEVLEVSVPYETFLKLVRAGSVEMSVGKTAFALRDKNVAALRDLSNRVNLSGQQGGVKQTGGGN